MASRKNGRNVKKNSDNGRAVIGNGGGAAVETNEAASPPPRLNVSFCIITHAPDGDNLKQLLATLPQGAEIVIVETVPSDEELPAMGRVWGAVENIERRAGQFGEVVTATWKYKRGDFCFATARNVSIDLATRGWCFWMDSDDRFTPSDGVKLRTIDGLPLGVVGIMCGCTGYQPPFRDDGAGTYYNTPHLRIFRNIPQLRFTGRVHEQIIPAIMIMKGARIESEILIRHVGYTPGRDVIKSKLQRNVALLYKHLAHPDAEDREYYQKILQNHLGTLDDIQAAEMPMFAAV